MPVSVNPALPELRGNAFPGKRQTRSEASSLRNEARRKRRSQVVQPKMKTYMMMILEVGKK